jgi:hypothetical protein
MKNFLFFILLMTISCNSQRKITSNDSINKQEEYEYTSEEDYKILEINETQNFYILLVSNKELEKLKIVIEKKCYQINNQKISNNNLIKLKTYSLFDVIFAGDEYLYVIDNKKVWRSNENIDLRFTGKMGNEKD